MEDVLIAGDTIKAEGVPLKASAIVGQEYDEGAMPLTRCLHVRENAAHLLIEPIYHRRVNRHATREIDAARRVERLPGRIHADFRLAVVSPVRSSAKPRTRTHDAQRLHARQTLRTENIPAVMVAVCVLGNLGGGCLQREMRRVVGQVEKPRAVGCLPCLLQEIQRMIGHRIGGVKGTLQVAPCWPPWKSNQVRRIKETLRAHERP